MQIKQHIYLFSSLIIVSLGVGVQANGWDVLQTVSIGSNLNLQQVDSHHSQQALNVIDANTASVHSQQRIDLVGNSNMLYQANGTNNQQALNLLNVSDLKSHAQVLLSGGELTLSQIEGIGNVQAANLLTTQGNLSAHQYLFVNRINLQQNKGQDNIQAGNMAIGNTGQLTQTFSAQQVNIKANGVMGTAVLQAANYVDIKNHKP